MPITLLKSSRHGQNQSLKPAVRVYKKARPTHASGPVLAQQAIGNQAMQRMLQAKLLQAKLTVNRPDDEYEKEADQVADTVMRMPEPGIGMPSSEPEKDEEEKRLQTKPLPGQNLHMIQRDVAEKEEDEEKKPLQTKPLSGQNALIQREEVSEDEEKKKKDEEKQIQTKSISGLSASLIQRETDAGAEEAGTEDERKRKDEKEKHLQTKSLSGETPSILDEARDEKRKARSENEEIGIISRKIASDKVGTTIEEHLLQSQGQGQPLDTETRHFFEPRFGHNFGKVRLHTGARAKETAMSLSARAFTFGENIAFGEGQYAPESKEGRLLLAHELTHVLQQSALSSQNTMQHSARYLNKEKRRYHLLQSMASRSAVNLNAAGKFTSVTHASNFPTYNLGTALSIRNISAYPMVIQRNFLADLWRGVTEIGPAVRRAIELVTTLITNPGKLPIVLAAIAWEVIPDRFKGPIIDTVLQACLTLARAMVVPAPVLLIGTILKNAAIGFLERALSYPTGMKVRVANRMASIITSPSMGFSFGYLKGLVIGLLWDGLFGPFRLLWDLIKILYQIVSAEIRFIVGMFNRQARESLGRDVQAALERVEARIGQAVSELMSGRSNPLAILRYIDQMINAVLRQVQSLGASLADGLLRFMNLPDSELGESLGRLSGMLTFEILLLILTSGGYTALKKALEAIKVGIQGWRAFQVLSRVGTALTTFRTLAMSNRMLKPLLEAVEEVFELLMRFLRFSYGMGGPGGAAARRGERATLEVADTAMHETHRLTYLAEGRIIRCSDRCMELTANIIERARQLELYRMPSESRRLVGEAEQIANEARALEANSALSEAEKTTQREALLRRAGSLERQTAAAEILIPERMAAPARQANHACQDILDRNPGNARLSGFKSEHNRIEEEIKKAVELADDPEMRPLVEDELRNLEQQARDLEAQMRREVPEIPEPPVTPVTGTGPRPLLRYPRNNLPTGGRHPYRSPNPGQEVVQHPQGGGYLDELGNNWQVDRTKARVGDFFEWDVQHPNGSHTNVGIDGMVTHGPDNF